MNPKWSSHFAVPVIVCLLFFQKGSVGLAQTTPDAKTIDAFFGAPQQHDTNATWQLLESDTNLVRPVGFRPYLPLLEAAADGDLRVVTRLIELGADVNAAGDTFLSGNAQMTALEGAARGDHAEICKLLLEKGADPNYSSFSGQTALHYVFEDLGFGRNTDREEIIRLLLKYGANPFSEAGYYKTTPFELEITQGDGKLVPRMLDAKAAAQFLEAHGAAMLSAAYNTANWKPFRPCSWLMYRQPTAPAEAILCFKPSRSGKRRRRR